MTTEFKGFIKTLGVKTGKGKKPPFKSWTLYSIKLADENGAELDHWLSAGFEPPAAKEGDYVSIIAEQNDKGYWDVKSLAQVKNAPAKATVAASSGGNNGGKSTSTQTSIHYQSARKDAITVLECLIASKALPISSAETKAGQAKRYEEIMALVDKITVRFFVDAETHRILETVADEGLVDDEPPAPGNDDVSEEDK